MRHVWTTDVIDKPWRQTR